VSLGDGRRSVSDVPIGFNTTLSRGSMWAGHMGYASSWPPGRTSSDGRDNVQVTFSLETPGPDCGLAEQEAGRFENGKWWSRRSGGDDSTRGGDWPTRVALNQSGFGVRLFATASFVRRARHTARESYRGK